MHYVGILLYRHEVGDLDRLVIADPADIIPAEVDEHDVFGALFRVVEELF